MRSHLYSVPSLTSLCDFEVYHHNPFSVGVSMPRSSVHKHLFAMSEVLRHGLSAREKPADQHGQYPSSTHQQYDQEGRQEIEGQGNLNQSASEMSGKGRLLRRTCYLDDCL